MADAKKPSAPAAGALPKKKGGGLKIVTFMICFGFAAPFIFPTIVLAALGLVPTLVALMIDTDRQKSGAAAVGAMNAAGLTPFVIDLWAKGQTIPAAMQILRDPFSWLVILGSAGIGQLIVYAVPAMMANLTLARAEARLKILRGNLDQLKAGWGADVATTKPVEQVGKG